MRPLHVAIAAAPEAPLSAPALARALHACLPDAEIHHSAAAEEAVLSSLFGEAVAPAPGPVLDASGSLRSGEGAWLAGCDALVVEAVTPSVLPTLLQALAWGVPVVAPHSAFAEALLGGGAALVAPGAGVEELAAAVVRLRADDAEREAVARRGRARARWLAGQRSVAGVPLAAGGFLAPAGGLPGTAGLPEPDPRRVSAIIPTRGGPRVHRCLRALRRAAGDVGIEVILAVTGALAGSLPACDQVVRCEPPFAWSKANNAALRIASHPLVLFLNDDCYFQREGDLNRLVECLARCGHLVSVAPRGRGFPERWEQTTRAPGSGLRETRFTLCGACFLARREAFWAVGEYDERFATYGCDEVDWFYRARAQGYRWAIQADVSVEHEWAATYGERRQQELPASLALFQEFHGVDSVDGPHWDPPRCAVSWVIASRNNAGHLARSLGTIAAQRHLYPEETEVVLALDGCTDSSAAVAREFNASLAEPLPLRIVEFAQPAGSPAKAKNRALRLALGDVHLPMDDDDATLPQRAALLAALEEDERADVAVGNFWLVGLDGTVTEKRVAPLTAKRLLQPGAQNWGLWATAVRRETWSCYGMHGEERPSNEDLELWLRWLRDGVKFRHVEAPVHLYLLRPGSTVFTLDPMVIGEQIRANYRQGMGAPSMGMQVAAEIGGEPPYRPWQRPGEMARLLALFRQLRPRHVLEIGTARGGSLWHWLEHVEAGATVVSVDLPWSGEDHAALFASWVPPGVAFQFLQGDAHHSATFRTVERLLPEIDFLFLDGDHTDEGVRADFARYGGLVRAGGVIALHDVAPAPPGSPIEVPRLWAEIQASDLKTEAFIEQPPIGGFGIGVVHVRRGDSPARFAAFDPRSRAALGAGGMGDHHAG